MQTFYNIETGNAAVFDDSAVISDWPGYTTTEPVVPEDTKAQDARAERNARLEQSDWTQLNDAPVDQAAWAAYRSALRDITDQAGFPNEITWPTAPTN